MLYKIFIYAYKLFISIITNFVWLIKCIATKNTITSKARIYNCSLKINGKNNKIILSNGVKLNHVMIAISGDNHEIVIKDKVVFREGGKIRLEGQSNNLTIDENSNLVNVFFSIGDSNTKILIGKNCLFSAEVIFRNWDNHSIVSVEDPLTRRNKGKDIIVDDHVWIGYGVTILKNIKIGSDAIIGTMSLVNKSVPENSIVSGNPAILVRNNVSWNEKWL